jgi:hypothetical protein
MRGQRYAREFKAMLDGWHSVPEVRDRELDIQIHQQYADRLTYLQKNWARSGVPYFSPSATSACPREQYYKLLLEGKHTSDGQKSAHQGRWQRIGTAVGDVIQRDLLFIEKHYKDVFDEEPPFKPEYTAEGYPAWEDFIYNYHKVPGKAYQLLGTGDGILQHKDGTRIGLEIKSKQTTSARTSEYTMRAPEAGHILQCVAYSIMYGLDKYLIVYVNLSKKSWEMSAEDLEKTPDVRVFEVNITEEMRQEVLARFDYIMKCYKDKTPPPMDILKWTFNSYKHIIAAELSEKELSELRNQVRAIRRSDEYPSYLKDAVIDAYNEIKDIREAIENAEWE